MSETTTAKQAVTGYSAAPTPRVTGANGVEYAYRALGPQTRPVLFLQHFRGNLDNWDPALVDHIAGARRTITFDNTGVGATSGLTPNNVAQMATDALMFLDAIEIGEVDLMGFSLGSFVAQEIALRRPDAVRRIVLASSAPQGGSGMHGWAADVINAVGGRELDPSGYLQVFYTASDQSRQAAMRSWQRMSARTEDRDAPTTWQTRVAQYDAVCAWGAPNHAMLNRLAGITHPTFVANGDSDPMILPKFSYLLTGLIPDARVKIYPDAGHGFLFQHHEDFGDDVIAFLDA